MKAPNFSLPDQNNKIHKLSDYKGKWLILYFYPKDNTSGCIKEACSFRDYNEDLKKLGANILGISKDPIKSHNKFADKFELNFSILSDETHQTIKAYGAWGTKKFMGREFEGIFRYTFIINPKGEIVKKYTKVKPLIHAQEVYEDLKRLQKEG